MVNEDVAHFVAFDLETTGLFAETDRVVEIGAVRFDASGCELDRFQRLVNPGRPMSPAAQAVHGISDADVAEAPPAREVLPAFLAFLGEPGPTQLLAHNAAFDAGFLGHELARAGLLAPSHAIIDTLALARRLWPSTPNHRLDTLAKLAGLDPSGVHRAVTDSLRVMGLWLALSKGGLPPGLLVSYRIADLRRPLPAPCGWDLLARAIADGCRVLLEYDGGSRGRAPREITPRRFAHRGGVAYLVAFCHLDSFEKSFRLDRVRRYELVDAAR
ncbi:MAG TPA: exonuclease domain-containing protein [Isosphaeraceae bacterium]|jgi:DNA polymerase III epsilon subunit family exonuclease|nr:exonuclease domain-containing protein [Isosphaeraceae bacterium]